MNQTKFEYRLSVTYNYCTVGNHVYYSRYFDFLEIARGELLRSLGIPLLILQDQGFIFPVLEASARYKRPARYDDQLVIKTWLTEIDKVRIRVAYEIFVGEKLILEAETLHVCTNLADKPVRIPIELSDKLKAYFVTPEQKLLPG